MLGRPPASVLPGSPAVFVAVAAADADDAVAGSPPTRIVIRGSRVVASTRTVNEYPAYQLAPVAAHPAAGPAAHLAADSSAQAPVHLAAHPAAISTAVPEPEVPR
jgi:hypothetical protein